MTDITELVSDLKHLKLVAASRLNLCIVTILPVLEAQAGKNVSQVRTVSRKKADTDVMWCSFGKRADEPDEASLTLPA
ncbi:hypothetical protein [Tardiphaga sp. 709]|uniref:hypothetical protein n=1 Tax=Tardiphaga sp. 709 TaxID=3076039 RepID=UPI0028EF2433|nr:hypothetical protein [Tardiphaga sp. 709]WNV11802.1 hypothetical protein RSO67_11840 [Tardiphaga sp. 709]